MVPYIELNDRGSDGPHFEYEGLLCFTNPFIVIFLVLNEAVTCRYPLLRYGVAAERRFTITQASLQTNSNRFEHF